MIISTNVPGSGLLPRHPPRARLLAAIDVEWSKNYRIRGGNVPFCYSVVWLALPDDDVPVGLEAARFWYTSAYVQDGSQAPDLVAGADAALACLMQHASLIAGHQLCSDLGVLAAADPASRPAVAAAATAWRQRREAFPSQPRFLDTRYDAGHLLACQSRRLVDVCADLRLDVTQPELRGTSMTALHRRWLQDGDVTAREKITVLNLRHSLSTAMIAARAAGLARWQPGLNVNRLLARELDDAFGWLAHPVFTALLGESNAA
ncbi:MAG TPA: hypothetical protein VIV12_25390 [Streptosporangiaceae bacterium]